MRHEVIASLEGARIVISDGTCQLDDYNFEVNSWNLKEQHTWPLSRTSHAMATRMEPCRRLKSAQPPSSSRAGLITNSR